ncbi:copper resistance D family protein [Paenibacillus sp. GSMTC-2017]|uniref:copper resistance D family protein n=1 Tax=Paenibacillus sp. GSMTC-2017 TaxID=2794350 RepID=UPI002FBEF526
MLIGVIGIVVVPTEISASGSLLSSHNHDSGWVQDGDSFSFKNVFSSILFYALRGAYYIMLLLTSGMMLLRLSIPTSSQGDHQRELLNRWSSVAVKGLLVVVLIFVFTNSNRMISELDGGGTDWLQLFTETSSGQLWMLLLILSLLAFVVIKLKDIYKAIWALLLLAVESFNGHAASSEYEMVAILSDFIHLACSALWAGGVMLLLLFWHYERKEAGRFIERFVSIAWVTIVALAISGAMMTAVLLPSWLYLIYTSWGNWLLAKIVFVLLVIVLGAALRKRAKRREMPNGVLLKLDGLLMTAIIIIVSIFTAISPLPDSEPLKMHEMGERLHFTIEISPNAPGPNEASLIVWLPEESGAPKEVRLQLRSGDPSKQRTIDVPLTTVDSSAGIAFPGFTEFKFVGEGVKLPYSGKWSAEISITDGAGIGITKTVPFRND